MDAGFCTFQVIFDESGKPVDYMFLETNRTFENLTGLKNAQGKLMRTLAPDHEQHWFDMYGKVATTGESIRIENEAAALNRWYSVYGFRIGAPEDRCVAVFFNDITNQKAARD